MAELKKNLLWIIKIFKEKMMIELTALFSLFRTVITKHNGAVSKSYNLLYTVDIKYLNINI